MPQDYQFTNREVVVQGWALEGDQVIFFIKEGGKEYSYSKSKVAYLNEKGEFDENKLIQRIMLGKLISEFSTESDFKQFT